VNVVASAQMLTALSDWVTEVQLGDGEMLFRQGDEADCLFVIDDGQLEVFLEQDPTMVIDRLGPGSVVGEMALLMGGQRSANGRARGDLAARRLSRDRFHELIQARPELGGQLSEALRERLRRTQLATHLRTIVGDLGAEALREVEREVEWVQLRSGEELFRQGQEADGAYILAVGRLRVAIGDGDGERVIDEIAPGEWVGEMGLLARRARSATVYAVRDCELVWLSREVFERVVDRHPSAMAHAATLLVTRLDKQMQGVSRRSAPPRAFAVVPIQPNVDAGWVARGLRDALSRHGIAHRIGASDVDDELGKRGLAQVPASDPAHVKVSCWLADRERTSDFVIYEAQEGWSPWTERAVRQADVVLFVADASGSPAPSEVERRFAALGRGSRLARQVLVLQQLGSGSQFAGTRRWLDARPDSVEHFHVRTGKPQDVERLARLLTRRGVGIVFAGGGSRGFAHIGVMRAMAEIGIPIDAVGGSSVGAMVAGACGRELDWAELLEHLPRLMQRAFTEPTLPVVSFMTGQAVLDGARALAGDYDIEDFARPVFVMATNLTRGRPETIRRGSVAWGIRASSAIPGIFPPVARDGDFLIDGGLANNLPIDVMADLHGGHVVAVDVIPEVDLEAQASHPDATSGVKELFRRTKSALTGRGDAGGMPSVLSVMMRTATSSAQGIRVGRMAARPSDLVLRPALSRWNMLDFSAADRIADEGYRQAREPLATWWEAHRDDVLGGTESNPRQAKEPA